MKLLILKLTYLNEFEIEIVIIIVIFLTVFSLKERCDTTTSIEILNVLNYYIILRMYALFLKYY